MEATIGALKQERNNIGNAYNAICDAIDALRKLPNTEDSDSRLEIAESVVRDWLQGNKEEENLACVLALTPQGNVIISMSNSGGLSARVAMDSLSVTESPAEAIRFSLEAAEMALRTTPATQFVDVPADEEHEVTGLPPAPGLSDNWVYDPDSWTSEEDDTLLSLLNEGHSIHLAAMTLNRSTRDVDARRLDLQSMLNDLINAN